MGYLSKIYLSASFDGFIEEIILKYPQCDEIIFHMLNQTNNKIEFLPKNLKCIVFGICFDSQMVYTPKKLAYVSFGSKFSQMFSMSKNIIRITFGHCYNQLLFLNKKLKRISFGENFNQIIELSKSLTHLFFGDDFNQYIELPKSLRFLIFGDYFNKPIQLPNAIINITFGMDYAQKIIFPESTDCVNINCLDYGHLLILNIIPNNVKKMYLGSWKPLFVNNLPNSVRVMDSYTHNNMYYSQ